LDFRPIEFVCEYQLWWFCSVPELHDGFMPELVAFWPELVAFWSELVAYFRSGGLCEKVAAHAGTGDAYR
jgi:hypothetical protein